MDNSAQVRQKPQARACEACRSAKVKCQPGPQSGTQSGICKRCSEFKRECVFRTGPRTRRPKATTGSTPLPPPPGPSKTFSIDFSMPAEEEPAATFDTLRDKHEKFLAELIPSSDEDEDEPVMSPSAVPNFNFSDLSIPMASASTNFRPLNDIGIKPQFNLDSAEKLLETFKPMLSHCPCVVLHPGVDVRSMARDSPFVLLAILAATSCSSSLQGHSLYDEEFRKVLGIKFVTGGERSLDLLQGIMVYSAWYPFHLRPKNRQAHQYLRMAVDIVRDLELDQEESLAANIEIGLLLDDDLDKMRSFVSCFYLVSVFSATWSKPIMLPYSQWIAKCCDLLEHNGLEQDQILVWLVRFQHTVDEITELNKRNQNSSHSQHQQGLIRIGLETQFRDWQFRIPPNLAATPSLKMFNLFVQMYISAGELMGAIMPRGRKAKESPPDPAVLMATTHPLRAFFDFVVSLTTRELVLLSIADWSRIVVCVILALRLSLPIDVCPGFDAAQARQILDFGSYLERLCQDPADKATAQSKKTDTCTAFRVVLRSVKNRFDKRVAAAEAAALAAEVLAAESRGTRGCPMFDGSLDKYIALWDGSGVPVPSSYATSQTETSSGPLTDNFHTTPPAPEETKPLVFHDLWATMTMGWAEEDMLNLDTFPDSGSI